MFTEPSNQVENDGREQLKRTYNVYRSLDQWRTLILANSILLIHDHLVQERLDLRVHQQAALHIIKT